MNELYLVIMFIVITITVFLWCNFGLVIESLMGAGGIILLTTVSFLMLVLSVSNTGKDIVNTYPATNTRIENELIIQAQNNRVPTQVVTDIKFIDAPVQIKKIITHNAWGGKINTRYEVELIKTEIQSQP